jgi:hypothetical protein
MLCSTRSDGRAMLAHMLYVIILQLESPICRLSMFVLLLDACGARV